MNDDTIRRKISRYLKKQGHSSIQIYITQGIVSLQGAVNSYEEYIEIGSFIGTLDQVHGIVNNLKYPGRTRKKRIKSIVNSDIGTADIVIIGAGVIGSAIARELSKYQYSIIVVEKEADVCCGASKANNALVHTGIGEPIGSLKQRLCAQGHKMFKELAKDLQVPYQETGMWMVTREKSFNPFFLPSRIRKFFSKYVLQLIILHRGKQLGIPLNRVALDTFQQIEPHANHDILSALFSPTYALTNPYLFTIALAENASVNGVQFLLQTEVIGFNIKDNKVKHVHTTKGIIQTSMVINATGLYADEVAEMAGACEYTIHPKKGAIILFDYNLNKFLTHPLSCVEFPQPLNYKGGGVLYTIEGNIQWGPTILECEDKTDESVTQQDIDEMIQRYLPLFPCLKKESIIQFFSGVRACSFTEDFIIRPATQIQGFIHVAGIQSPGLTAAPAIAKMVSDILRDLGWNLKRRVEFKPLRHGLKSLKECSLSEKQRYILDYPKYGNIICRCELVSEGELIDAIHSPIPVTTIDGLKRRTRIGMGRCQGGFCLLEAARILSRETGIPLELITKKGENSHLFIGPAKCLLRGDL